MKILYVGAQKSGKSKLAEKRVLELSKAKKPIYLATSELFDEGMRQKAELHRVQRGDGFVTVESHLDLATPVLSAGAVVLVECLGMWINNMIYHGKTDDEIIAHTSKLLAEADNIVFVLTDVSGGIVSENPDVRRYVDLCGIIGQMVATACDEVYLCAVGLSVRMK